ncbi:hypothetical protein HYX14_06085 [Candidatus Woesearchaeota archaeon]|nr:hypothetical protein [Candidatus Woesearchaeota archaeon]
MTEGDLCPEEYMRQRTRQVRDEQEVEKACDELLTKITPCFTADTIGKAVDYVNRLTSLVKRSNLTSNPFPGVILGITSDKQTVVYRESQVGLYHTTPFDEIYQNLSMCAAESRIPTPSEKRLWGEDYKRVRLNALEGHESLVERLLSLKLK